VDVFAIDTDDIISGHLVTPVVAGGRMYILSDDADLIALN
jgi:hypothetical protein